MIIGILPDLYCCFSGGLLFGNEWFVALCFPSREGIEGCVTVKVACWVEGLRDTVSRRLVLRGGVCRLRVDVFGFRWLCLGVMRAHWNDFHGYLVDPVENGLGKSLIHGMMLRADCPLMKAVTK